MRRVLRRVLMAVASAVPIPAVCRALARRFCRTAVPVVLWIDAEPDDREVDRNEAAPWLGFEDMVPRIPPLRERLARITDAPVQFTWGLRMDPQVAETWGSPVWAIEAYADEFAEIQRTGDELAVHVHIWRWEPDPEGHWVMDFDPDWNEHCMTMALDTFESAFGKPCLAHRGGDRYLSGSMLTCLRERGAKIDLTVESGFTGDGMPVAGHPDAQRLVDHRAVPPGPYRSSPSAFPAPDPSSDADPLIVSLTTSAALKGDRRTVLTPGTHPGLFAIRLLRELLRQRPPVLAFATRTDPVHLSYWSNVVKNMEHLARHPGVRFVTASEAADELSSRVTPASSS